MPTASPQLQVKEHLGKEQYKHRLLPLLRRFRQDKDGSQFTLGMLKASLPAAPSVLQQGAYFPVGLRELALPLLPNPELLQAFSCLLPKALQLAFIAQLEVRLPSCLAEHVEICNAVYCPHILTDLRYAGRHSADT